MLEVMKMYKAKGKSHHAWPNGACFASVGACWIEYDYIAAEALGRGVSESTPECLHGSPIPGILEFASGTFLHMQ